MAIPKDIRLEIHPSEESVHVASHEVVGFAMAIPSQESPLNWAQVGCAASAAREPTVFISIPCAYHFSPVTYHLDEPARSIANAIAYARVSTSFEIYGEANLLALSTSSLFFHSISFGMKVEVAPRRTAQRNHVTVIITRIALSRPIVSAR